MMKYIEKSCLMRTSIIIMISLAVIMMSAGCAEKPNFEIESGSEAKKEVSEWTYDGGAYVRAMEKNELVTAHANPDGTIKETDVRIELKKIERGSDKDVKSGSVRDKTDLTDISNKNGNEEFERKDEYIYFKNLGSDISYEGKSRKELPVSLTIKYYLDGEEKSPAEIKGKKGHVKIEYSLSNDEACEIDSEGILKSALIPFTAVSIVMLEGDSNRNIETKDCKLSSFNSEEVIMGFTMPGISENIKHLNSDADSVDIPEKFSFEMDTDSFEMGFSTTIVTSGLLDESIDLSSITDLRKSLTDLSDAARKLANAGNDVDNGTAEFGSYLSKYAEGSKDLNDGVDAVKTGLKTIAESGETVTGAAQGLCDGIEALRSGYDESLAALKLMQENDPDNEELASLVAQYEMLSSKTADMAAAAAKNADVMNEYTEGISNLLPFMDEIKKGSSELSASGTDLTNGYESIKQGIDQYTQAVCDLYRKGIQKFAEEGNSKINDLESFVRLMEKADDMYDSYSGSEEDQDCSTTFIIETEKI